MDDSVPLPAAVNLLAETPGIRAGLTAAIIILVVLSCFFSAAEAAFMSVNRIRLKTMENNGSKRAKKVLKQLENPDRVLNAMLIGNNIVNITAASLATVLFSMFIASQSLATLLSTVVLALAVLIFGDIIPKSIAKEKPEQVALFAQPFVTFWQVILTPFSWFLGLWRKIYKPKKHSAMTEDELSTIIEEAEEGGVIDSHEFRLLRSAIEFDDVELYDIMVPRVNVIAAEDTDDIETITAAFAENGFSRLPVYRGSLDTIIGILHEKDFNALIRAGGTDFLTIVQDCTCLSRNMKISSALRTLQKAKSHMAVVVDEFGGTSGIVTMEDILEELVGEIYDEHDEEEILSKRIDDNTFIVSGEYSLEDMFEDFGIEPKDEFESTSVGGWVTEEMKKIPLAGESFKYANLEIAITKADARRVIEVKAALNHPDENDEEANGEE